MVRHAPASNGESIPGRSTPSAAPVFSVRRDGPNVFVAGEIDAHAAPVFRDVLAAGPVEIIDLSEVTFFSAAGVNVLVGLRRAGFVDPIVRTSPVVDRLFRLCRPDLVTP